MTVFRLRSLLILAGVVNTFGSFVRASIVDDPFIVKPWLQLGNRPTLQPSESFELMWQSADEDVEWKVDVRSPGEDIWRPMAVLEFKRLAFVPVPPHRIYSVKLTGRLPGVPFEYRVVRSGENVFQAMGRARKKPGQAVRFVLFGDCGENTAEQKAIAKATYDLSPDFVMLTGDIVYSRGLLSEYRTKFFPIYNSDEASAATGAPLLRSVPFIAAPGNHDLLHRDLDKTNDALSYFYLWSQPLNGPLGTNGTKSTPTLSGKPNVQDAFLKAAGERYPRMANYSFDYGNAHWTVIDANPYVDWTKGELREWVEADLAKSSGATWRFVALHQPPFNSSPHHFSEQQIRYLADVFEKGKVDIVFGGHVHNYQRTYPLFFEAKPGQVIELNANGEPKSPVVEGVFRLDKNFDGVKDTRPNGVIYVISGGGGAHLYDPDQTIKPDFWQAFTHKFVPDKHSLTFVRIDGGKLILRQVAADGSDIDAMTINK